jgi:hypothetical protein
LLNTGISLTTTIPPDELGELEPMPITLTSPVAGNFSLSGTVGRAATLVVEGTSSLTPPVVWHALQTNNVPAGPFNLTVPQRSGAAGFYRLRGHLP